MWTVEQKTELQIVEPLVETLRVVFQDTLDGAMCDISNMNASEALTEWFAEGNKLVIAFDIDGVNVKLISKRKK